MQCLVASFAVRHEVETKKRKLFGASAEWTTFLRIHCENKNRWSVKFVRRFSLENRISMTRLKWSGWVLRISRADANDIKHRCIHQARQPLIRSLFTFQEHFNFTLIWFMISDCLINCLQFLLIPFYALARFFRTRDGDDVEQEEGDEERQKVIQKAVDNFIKFCIFRNTSRFGFHFAFSHAIKFLNYF